MEKQTSSLINQALTGDQKAFSEIVNQYQDKIFNFVIRTVKERELAEDITQETFIKAYKALASFNSEYAFSTWLYKIAANNCIDHFRKKRLKTYSLDTPITAKDGELYRDYPDNDDHTPEYKLIIKEKSIQIIDAINSLPKKYKEVILLRHTKDKSYEEISEELNIPLGTVKVRIFRAREMLKMKLKSQLRG